MHCHQIREAERAVYRSGGEPIPDEVLFPYPDPSVLGLTMDPKEMATITGVAAGSVADRAGLRAGDEIVTLAGQPLLSIADLQWVLQNTPATARLARGPPRRQDADRDPRPPRGLARGKHLLADHDLGPAADGLRRDVLADLSDEHAARRSCPPTAWPSARGTSASSATMPSPRKPGSSRATLSCPSTATPTG